MGVQRVEYGGREYEVIRGANDLGFYSDDEEGAPLRTFANLERFLATQDLNLRFATNGGIFEPDLNPTGLWIVDGKHTGRSISPTAMETSI